MTKDIFADALAHADDKTQAEFLNRLFDTLRKFSAGTEYQLCSIAEHLTADAAKAMQSLGEFFDLRQADLITLSGDTWKLRQEIQALDNVPTFSRGGQWT